MNRLSKEINKKSALIFESFKEISRPIDWHSATINRLVEINDEKQKLVKLKNKLLLYLDDVRTPKNDEWVVARNYDEFIKIIKLKGLELFELISLDHDLGETAMIEYYNNV